MRPARPSPLQSGQSSPLTNASSFKSGFTPLSDEAFLRHRGDERPVALKYKSAREAARAMQVRRILRVQQPLIGTERAVRPQFDGPLAFVISANRIGHRRE